MQPHPKTTVAEANGTDPTPARVADGVVHDRLVSRSVEVQKRRLKILRHLERYCERYPEGARPLDLGAWDASHHSNDLKAMAKLGLVEVCPRYMGVTGMLGYSGSNRYKITEKGRKIAANYGKSERKAGPDTEG